MKKLILLLMAAGLITACEQRIEAPDNAGTPAEKEENNTTILNPPSNDKDTEVKVESNETRVEAPAAGATATESTSTTTTTE